MYPYHNKIKQRIKNGELITFDYVEAYKDIKPALLLFFSTKPHIRVVRNYRFVEYYPILERYSLDIKIKEIKDLYTKVFHDGKNYTDEVFNSVYFPEKARFITDEDGVISTFAFLLPKTLSFYGIEKKCLFLSAVATAPKKRRQGYMRRLLKNILDELYLKENPFIMLSPANEDYYTPFGFRTVLRGQTRYAKFQNKNPLSLRKIKDFNEFANVYNSSNANFDITINRDDAEGMQKVYNASNIDIFKVFDGENYRGYFVFDEEEIFDYDLREEDFSKIEILDGKKFVFYGEGDSRYMARVVCPDKAIDGIKCDTDFEDKTITVVDEFLQKTSNICVFKENGRLKTRKVKEKGTKICVEELTDWIFGLSSDKVGEIMGCKQNPKIKFLDKYL